MSEPSETYSVGVPTAAEFLSTIRTASEFLADTPVDDHASAVPACPGWTVADVVVHVGRVYAMVTAIVSSRSTEPRRAGSEHDRPEPRHLVEWFAERRSDLVTALDGVTPDVPVWTWADEQRAAFYFRRMAHETVVHAYDVAEVRGVAFETHRRVTVDGIDEYFDVMLPFALRRRDLSLPTGSLHLHCTDGDGEWFVAGDAGRVAVERVHRKGDVAWRGAVLDLLAAAWGRRSPRIDVVGDAGVSDEWSALAP